MSATTAHQQAAVIAWLGKVLPIKVSHPQDVQPVDYAQLLVHFNPHLANTLCFDAEAPTSSHTKSLAVVLTEVLAQQPAVKSSKVTAQGVVTRDSRMCGVVCEALYQMGKRSPFPRTYNPKAERARLTRVKATKRPLSEVTNSGCGNGKQVLGGGMDLDGAGSSSISTAALRGAAASKGKAPQATGAGVNSSNESSSYFVCPRCIRQKPWSEVIPKKIHSSTITTTAPTASNLSTSTSSSLGLVLLPGGQTDLVPTTTTGTGSNIELGGGGGDGVDNDEDEEVSAIQRKFLLELRSQFLDLVALDVDKETILAVLIDHAEQGAPGYIE